jgi:hypothetical protein
MRTIREKLTVFTVGACTAAVMTGSIAFAGPDPFVFPARGQSAEQTEQDKYTCYSWAKGQTGFDPMQVPTATAPPPPTKGGAVKGAAGGAIVGVTAGAIAGNAGKGAAIGAATGGLIGGIRKKQSQKEQQQYAQQQAAEYEQRRNDYNRAWSACMEGKGYTVK